MSPGYHHVEEVMGTTVSIDVRDRVDGTPGLAEVVDWLHHVDRTFSTYREDSPITRLGRGELTLDEVGDEIADVLLECERLRLDSDGAFDAFSVPAPNGTSLDPSGYVKGWSIERAAHLLEAHGLRDFCINAGGDVVLRGTPSDGEDWRIGIRHPERADALAAVVAARGPVAIATSATYERGAHIVDPRAGHATTHVSAATVIGPDLTLADAYATTLFVLGVDGLDWLATHHGYDGLVITHDGAGHTTAGFAHWLATGPSEPVASWVRT